MAAHPSQAENHDLVSSSIINTKTIRPTAWKPTQRETRGNLKINLKSDDDAYRMHAATKNERCIPLSPLPVGHRRVPGCLSADAYRIDHLLTHVLNLNIQLKCDNTIHGRHGRSESIDASHALSPIFGAQLPSLRPTWSLSHFGSSETSVSVDLSCSD